MEPPGLRHVVTAAEQQQTTPLPPGRLHTARVLLCTAFRSPPGGPGAVCPRNNAVLESAGQGGSRQGQDAQGAAASLTKTAGPGRPAGTPESRGARPQGPPTVSRPPASRRGLPRPSPGFPPGKWAPCRIVFWGHLHAYTGPIPRKQSWPSIRAQSATPQCSRTSSGEMPESQPEDSKCTRCQQKQPQSHAASCELPSAGGTDICPRVSISGQK